MKDTDTTLKRLRHDTDTTPTRHKSCHRISCFLNSITLNNTEITLSASVNARGRPNLDTTTRSCFLNPLMQSNSDGVGSCYGIYTTRCWLARLVSLQCRVRVGCTDRLPRLWSGRGCAEDRGTGSQRRRCCSGDVYVAQGTCMLLKGHVCCSGDVYVAQGTCMLLKGHVCCSGDVYVAKGTCMLLRGRVCCSGDVCMLLRGRVCC